jgi:hypothetical protein
MAAQSNEPNSQFPHTEIILAESSFIDIGPPFDFYSLYRLTSTASGTDVEKIAVTPPGDACLQPATTEVSHAHLQQSLAELFNHKDLCVIPEKDLHREAKRCKHCLTFSGVHVVAQVQCGGKPRDVRYEILDRDIFDSRTNTPAGTSNTMKLLSTLNDAFGGGAFDRPVFPVATPNETAKPLQANLPILNEISEGKYDSLFGEKISLLYKDSQLPHNKPSVTLETSSPSAPITATMPPYPPIARVAHIQGAVSLELQIGADGKVAEAKWIDGPKMFQAISLDATRKWSYPIDAAQELQSVKIQFKMNCPDTTTSSSATPH